MVTALLGCFTSCRGEGGRCGRCVRGGSLVSSSTAGAFVAEAVRWLVPYWQCTQGDMASHGVRRLGCQSGMHQVVCYNNSMGGSMARLSVGGSERIA